MSQYTKYKLFITYNFITGSNPFFEDFLVKLNAQKTKMCITFHLYVIQVEFAKSMCVLLWEKNNSEKIKTVAI